jgi:hypothetical protein
MLRAWAVLAGPHRGLGNWVRGKRSDHNPAKPSAAPFISERPVDLAAAPMRTRRKWVLTKSRTVTADAGFRRFVAACGAHLEDLRERRRLGGARAPRAAPGDGRPALQAALIVPREHVGWIGERVGHCCNIDPIAFAKENVNDTD